MREVEPFEVIGAEPYPEGRDPFGLADVSVCGPMLMTEREREFLLRSLPAKATYCELGTWAAATLCWIADRRPEVHCVGVDFFRGLSQRRLLAALANWELRRNVDLFLGPIERFAWRDSYFDLVLVDADHTADGVYRDLDVAANLAKSTGMILCHDYGSPAQPEVKPGVDRWCEEQGWIPAEQVDSLIVLRWSL